MKKSFKLFIDSLDVLDELSDEQAGQLFKAIHQYEVDGTEVLNGLMKAVFTPFKNNIDRAKYEYDAVCERNKANGLKGGRPNPNKPTGLKSNPNNPDKDKDKDKDKDTYIIPDFINQSVWNEWVQHRKEIKKALTPSTIKKQLKQLEDFNRLGMDTTEVINASIAGGYAGLFALRTGKKYEPTKSKMDVTMETYERAQEMKRQQSSKQNFIDGELA